jgi:hypothetical protein
MLEPMPQNIIIRIFSIFFDGFLNSLNNHRTKIKGVPRNLSMNFTVDRFIKA